MTYNLSGKRAIVTGASRGIGEAIARTLASEGVRLALVARSGERLQALAEELPGDPVVVSADLSGSDQWEGAAAKALEALGGLDILVNNAGVSASETLANVTAESLDRVLQVNVRNLILFTHAVTPALVAARGSVVNISSVSAFSGGLGQIAYSASKGAVNSFTRNASIDLGRHGVRVNAVAPGVIDDGMWKTAFENGVDREKTFARMRSLLPLEGRWGRAQDVADAVAWLASEKSAYVTGQVLRVDGGMII
jgi:NAD(P)-dependent dehydrogenase (short-subunit alcohol dehydrogenase family)